MPIVLEFDKTSNLKVALLEESLSDTSSYFDNPKGFFRRELSLFKTAKSHLGKHNYLYSLYFIALFWRHRFVRGRMGKGPAEVTYGLAMGIPLGELMKASPTVVITVRIQGSRTGNG